MAEKINLLKKTLGRREFIKYTGAAGAAIAVSGFPAVVLGKKIPVRVGYLVGAELHQTSVPIHKEKHILEDAGFEVMWREFIAGPFVMQHFAGGDVDVAYLGIPPAMISRGAGVKIKVVSSLHLDGSSLVVKPGITKLSQLDGRNVGTPGVGSIQDAMLSMVEKKHGIKVIHKHIKVTDQPIYLKTGEIDGYITWEPFGEMAEYDGYGNILLRSKDMFPGHQCCVLVVSENFLENNPKAVKKIVELEATVRKYQIANAERVLKWVSKYTLKPLEVIKRAYVNNMTYNYPILVDHESTRTFIETCIEQGKIRKERVPDIDKFMQEFIDERFVPMT